MALVKLTCEQNNLGIESILRMALLYDDVNNCFVFNSNAVGGGGGGTGDASAANQLVQITGLNNILTEAIAINGGVDGLEALQQATTDAINALSTSNSTDFSSVVSALSDIEADTANLETLVGALSTINQSEFDQSQVILTNILTEVAPKSRTAGFVEVTAAGAQTISVGNQSVSIRFWGDGGTLNGVDVYDGFEATFDAGKNYAIGNVINYTIPTSADSNSEQRVTILTVG